MQILYLQSGQQTDVGSPEVWSRRTQWHTQYTWLQQHQVSN